MNYNTDDINNFLHNIWDESFSNNNGGMGAPDLFSLYCALDKIKPKIVIESGIWNGVSTKLIRKTLPDAIIICLDPREIPQKGFKDPTAIYHTGTKFIDFKELDLTKYDPKDIFCFFDDHQNAYLRLVQCVEKKISNILFNDNYPFGCGSHYTIEHAMKNDTRHFSLNKTNKLLELIDTYFVYPNIYPGNITTGEGNFKCNSYFQEFESGFNLFIEERNKYRWNTYIKLKVLE
jgi:hypothetical protein